MKRDILTALTMNNALFCMAACVFCCMTASASTASVQEADFVRVALEQLRDRMERDDKGTLDKFVADVSTASRLSAAVSRDSLISLLRDLKTHCKKSTALGEQLFALHGEHFSEREAKAYLVRVVDMAGDLLKKEENVGLEPLIARAASKSKLLKFQALDYTVALLVPFVGSPVAEELVEAESAVNVPTGTFKVLVRTRNSNALQASTVIKLGRTRSMMVRSQILYPVATWHYEGWGDRTVSTKERYKVEVSFDPAVPNPSYVSRNPKLQRGMFEALFNDRWRRYGSNLPPNLAAMRHRGEEVRWRSVGISSTALWARAWPWITWVKSAVGSGLALRSC